MADKSKPTSRQVSLLKEWGLRVPSTRFGARLAIAFVSKGNGAGPAWKWQRIDLLRSAQEKYIGQTARLLGGGHCKVLDIVPKSPAAIEDTLDLVRNLGYTKKIQPLMAVVLQDPREKYRGISLDELELTSAGVRVSL